MSDWTVDELAKIETADELQIAPLRRDGTQRDPVTIWVVRNGDDVFVRAFKGPEGWWYRTTQARHEGHIRAGGVDKDVSFVVETDAGTNEKIDTAYRTKYQRYDAQFVDPMVAPPARAATLKLVPR